MKYTIITEFESKIGNSQIDVGDIKLASGMSIEMDGPRRYMDLEKVLVKKNLFKFNIKYKRPTGKSPDDFPSKQEFIDILLKYEPTGEIYEKITWPHQFILYSRSAYTSDGLGYVQTYEFPEDMFIINGAYRNIGKINWNLH